MLKRSFGKLNIYLFLRGFASQTAPNRTKPSARSALGNIRRGAAGELRSCPFCRYHFPMTAL